MKLHLGFLHHGDKVDGAATAQRTFHGEEVQTLAFASPVTEQQYLYDDDDDDDDDDDE